MKDNSGSAIAALLVVLILGLAVAWAVWGQSAPAVAAPSVAPARAPAAPAAEFHVCATCAYTTVQSAVDAAHPGDVVKVAAGVYTGVHAYDAYTQVVYIDKSLVLQGGYTTTNWTAPDPDANHTTLDAERQGRVLCVTGDVSVTIEGLRITGGRSYLGGGALREFGGGVYVSTATVTISHCLVYSNFATGRGGGVSLHYSSATLIGNTIRDNIMAGHINVMGGGLYSSQSLVTLIDNVVQGNTADPDIVGLLHRTDGYGGGLYLAGGTATLSGNVVRDNVASTYGWGFGGGVCLEAGAARLNGNTIQDNIACHDRSDHEGFRGRGGGLYFRGSDIWLSDNTIVGNTAITTEDGFGYGGGLYLMGGTAALNGNTIVSNTATSDPSVPGLGGGLYLWFSDSFTLTNNLVAGNHATTQGGGLWFGGYSTNSTTGRLLHTTVADNGQQGVYVGDYTTLTLTNTIVAGHPGQGIATTGNSTVTLAGTLWHANGVDVSGLGVVSSTNVTGPPAFVDPGAWDYHLAARSAAIDAGVPPVPGVTTDIDGDPRPAGAGYDVGADEYRTVGVQLAPDRSAITAPGTAVAYTHTLTNTGNYTDAFVLAAGSSQTWAQVSPTDPVTLAAGATQAVRVTVTVPTDAISGMVDATTVTATSLVAPAVLATATDTTTVGPRRLYLPIAFKAHADRNG